MTYQDGVLVALDDVVEHCGQRASVIGMINEDGEFKVSIGCEWILQEARGLWLWSHCRAVVGYNTPDEDIVFIARADKL